MDMNGNGNNYKQLQKKIQKKEHTLKYTRPFFLGKKNIYKEEIKKKYFSVRTYTNTLIIHDIHGWGECEKKSRIILRYFWQTKLTYTSKSLLIDKKLSREINVIVIYKIISPFRFLSSYNLQCADSNSLRI